MNTIRKALLPSGIALAFLLFLGTVGSTPVAFAGVGDICAIDGPDMVAEGALNAYWVTIDSPAEDAEYTITVDDGTGDGDIIYGLDGIYTSDLEDVNGDVTQDNEAFSDNDFSTGLSGLLEGHYGFDGADACGSSDDLVVLVVVECHELGRYTINFSDESENDDNMSIDVECRGDVDSGTITARPTTVEIAPSYANVSKSLITVNLLDDLDEAAVPGSQVIFQTDRCSIEESAVDTEVEFETAEGDFRVLNALNPATARDIENDYQLSGPPDSSPQFDETSSFSVTSPSGAERTIAAAILHCDPIAAPGVTPGVANITAIVDRGGDDLVLKTTVTVVGPPAANGVTVTASPASLICGEKATISVDIKDSIGQPVSDHTLLEAVTNAGGVLGGTGAVAGFAGPVVPISSTVAETFGGKATIYLLTSSAHVGKYEVVITTGGGGGVTGQLYNGGDHTNYLGGLFTTPPISVQVTVECTVPAAAPAAPVPTVRAPTTGQGITPPSTGDAGLATSGSSSWTLVAGAVVAAMVFGSLVISKVRQD